MSSSFGMTAEEQDHLIDEVKDYQLTHGLIYKQVVQETTSRTVARSIGMSTLPTPFPRVHFDHAHSLQQSMNLLYMKAAADVAWMSSVIAPLLEIDELAKALWTVWQNIAHAKHDRVICGIFQSEYMLHKDRDDTSLKQVEMNTFAVSGATHSQLTTELHQQLQDARLLRQTEAHHIFTPSVVPRSASLPSNDNVHELMKVLRHAHKHYKARMVTGKPCILMIVQDKSPDVADERRIEFALLKAEIACHRCKWSDIKNLTILTSDNVLLFSHLNTLVEVGLVYFRAGHEPEAYNAEGISARTRLELSHAIKCPDILTHLTTFKSVQHALTKPGAVERFLPSADAVVVRDTFMPMQPLDETPEGMQAIKEAEDQTTAVNYVLKPNLDGSNYNVNGKQIARFMCRLRGKERARYILMRAIMPPTYQGMLLREHMVYEGAVNSELGILGTSIWRRRITSEGQHEIDVLTNQSAGWTFKSKPLDVRHVSILKGYGCLDTPDLFD